MPTTPRLPFDDDAPAPAGAGAPAESGAPPLPDARDRADAVDPRQNVVLEASAGTGKTRVLVDRYVNLVRAGVEPKHILAITFTRKAAAEMRERILATLRREAVEGGIDQRRWRGLRERLSDVAISTIDAFCLSLLREFPLEAGLDPGFGMADETEALRLTDEALDRTLRICRAVAREDPAVALVFAELGDFQLRNGLAGLLDRRLVAGPILDRAVRPTPRELTPQRVAEDALRRLGDTLHGVDGGLARFLATGPVRHPRYRLLAEDIRRGIGEGGNRGTGDAEREIRLLIDGLEDYFFTKSRTPRKKWTAYKADDGLDAASLRAHRAAASALAERLAVDLAAFRRDLNAVLTRGVWKLFRIARAEYRDVLEEHAVVDFPDALERALALLEQRGEFTRSRYLLESRYHHLLVDEFQDTSDAQWRLVWHLVQSWREGLGMDQDQPLRPTIFVVGDRKQSIYGFRDADARVLGRAAVQIAQLREEGDVRRAIRQSFRAVPALLAFANDLFAAVDKRPEREDAFTYAEQDMFPVAPAGQGAGGPTGVAGDSPLNLVVGPDLEAQAAAVAAEIGVLVESGIVRDRQTGARRRAAPGDIAILFRTREGHQAFERALAARGVPSYVYKGLGFFDADEVKDVFALLRYLANPVSDLRAAAFLRSRLARLSDQALSALAPDLASAIVSASDRDAALDADDRAVLDELRRAVPGWLALADRVPPSELLDHVLGETAYAFEVGAGVSGPARRQARENLKKVRALVRRIQNRGYATLARVSEYLDRLSAGDESSAAVDAVDAVNLMTMHAAKGLEFPVVFLVNLGRGAGGGRDPIRVAPIEDDEEAIAVSVGTFRSAADDDASDRDREELKRLFYVAVTRARDRLYLATTLDAKGRFEAMKGGLGEVLPAELRATIERAAVEPPEVAAIEWRGTSTAHHFRRVIAPAVEPLPAVPARPGFVAAEPVVGAPDLRRLDDPSAIARRRISARGELPTPPRPDAPTPPDRPHARAVGTLVHRLLERDPLLGARDAGRLRLLAERLLRQDDRRGTSDPGGLAEEAATLAARMAAEPALADRLRAGRRWHEVPVAFREGDVVWRGTLDVLIEPDEAHAEVVEFKTGRRRPGHDDQLRLYVEAVRALRPEATVTGRLAYLRAADADDGLL